MHNLLEFLQRHYHWLLFVVLEAVSLVLLLLVARIIFVLRRDRKQGKSTCGCNCGSCPMSGSCHKQS